MKRLTIFSLVAVFALAVSVGPVAAAISMSGEVASGVQSLEADSDANPTDANGNLKDQSLGFNDPAANLHVYGDVASGVDAYVEMQSRVGVQNDFTVEEAYITLDELLAAADVKIGQYEIDFGNQHLRRSNFADVQDNPLIGNSLVDPYTTQSGVEFSGSANQFAWSAGVTNGASQANFGDSQGLAYNVKVWGDITPALSGAVSYYTSDHDAGAGQTSSLFATGGNESYQLGGANSQATNGGGNEVSAWQLDASYDLSAHDVPASIDAWYGSTEEDVTGGTDNEMDYYGALGQYDINPQTFVAARYEVAINENSGVNNNDEADRIQVGAGYNLNSSTLAKIEYITQENERRGPGAGLEANGSHEFDGITGELSVSF